MSILQGILVAHYVIEKQFVCFAISLNFVISMHTSPSILLKYKLACQLYQLGCQYLLNLCFYYLQSQGWKPQP